MRTASIRDHNGIEILDPATCHAFLAMTVVGRLGFVEAGSPVIVPVNYALDRTGIVFRSTVGAKLDAAARGRPVAFEIDHLDPTTRSGWSVVVTGVADLVDHPTDVARLDALPLDPWALGDRDDLVWVRVRPDTVTGRRVGPAN